MDFITKSSFSYEFCFIHYIAKHGYFACKLDGAKHLFINDLK
jgi:hypothetical protein